MFKVLLVVPRFLLLDLKFLFHDRVRQHLHRQKEPTLRFIPVREHDTVTAVVNNRSVPCRTVLLLPPVPVCAAGSSPDRQADGQTVSQL